jgi:2-iminobutanoate/2-iminopropanoate deaminase
MAVSSRLRGGVTSLTLMALTIATGSAGAPGGGNLQRAPESRKVIRPERFPATGLPYSPGILAGHTLYLSGQLGRDPETARLVPGGIEAETRQALRNLREVLKAAGMDYGDVVSVTAFITDFADFPKFNAAYAEVFGAEPPARATVQVSGLNLGARVEIQMIAARP